MQKFLTFTFLFLSFLLPTLAQTKALTIKNIRFIELGAARQAITKIVQVDEFSTDIYTSDDILHIKILPSEIDLDFRDEVVTLGVITATSEKKRTTRYGMTLTFDLTDGNVTYPCVFVAGGVFNFLHKATNTELVFKGESQAQEIKLISERHTIQGTFVIIPIKATVATVNTDRAVSQTRRSTRSVSNREEKRD